MTGRDEPAALTLRRAGDADVEAIRELVRAAYEGYVPLIGRTPLPMLTDYAVAVARHEIWLLENATGVAALIELEPRDGHLWIDNVAVAPAWQRRGLGRRLLAFAEDEAKRLGLGEMQLLTNERYVENIAMYLRHGYLETRREPFKGTDLVYFRKTLDERPLPPT